MECNFHIGQKVVCVDTWNDDTLENQAVGPIKGIVYTIREIGIFHPVQNDIVAVRLVEIQNPVHNVLWGNGTYEVCFGAFRFRPLITKSTETGMAIFKEILNTQKVPEFV